MRVGNDENMKNEVTVCVTMGLWPTYNTEMQSENHSTNHERVM
jgi:hypothetical protein